MARSDLLVALVQAGARGDRQRFRKTVEALIAEERGKHHNVLADQLAASISRNGSEEKLGPQSISDNTTHNLLYEVRPERLLGDLVLPRVVVEACTELAEEHHRVELLRSYNLEPRNRVLLVGPPGNGKTSLAEALAATIMIPLFVVRYEGVIASYLGETAGRLQQLFDFVRTRHCLLFFDEFDTLGKERGDEHETGEIKRVVSSLLLQIDRLPSHVLVVTATNHPELLDRAVWRRFQVRLTLPPPTRQQIADWLRDFSERTDFSFGYAPRTLADKLAGASFAEVEEVATDVRRRYILRLPDPDVRAIVRQRMEQWSSRARVSQEEGR
jgi:AAA+ superfamily predicted ATPase